MLLRRFLFVFCLLCAVVSPAVATADYRAAVLADDPTVYLRLGERAGTTALNSGSHGGYAEIHGAPDRGVYGALESDPASDRAIRLDDATGDHLLLRPEPGSSVRGEYTAEAWVNLDAHRGRDFLFAGGAADLYFEQFSSTVFTGGVISANPTPRRWYHVAVTARAGEVELFLDGVSQGSHPVFSEPVLYDDARPLYVGWELLGAIDEVALYDRVLPAARIAEHHRIGIEGVAPVRPASIAAPSASGAPAVGSTLTCDEGEWSNGPREFAFRWLRDGQPIDRATDARYSVSSDDRGHQVRCAVIARNAAGASAEALSAPIAIPGGTRATTYRDLILEDAPRFYLPLDEREPGAAFPNHGRDGGDAQIVGNPLTGVYGAVEGDVDSDRAIRLDGNDSLVLRPEPGRAVRDTFTVEGWVKQDRHGGQQFLFNHGGETRLEEYSLSTPAGAFNGEMALREWHHVVMTVRGHERYRPGEAEVWVDGVSRGTLPLTLTGFWEWVYGGDRDQTIGWQLAGWIDELAVYDYRLSGDRIAEHHRRGRAGWTPPVPTHRAAPSVHGTPTVGSTARCDEGDWNGGPRVFTFRWLRDGQPIPGADEQRHSLGAHDLNHAIACEVTAANAAGTSSAVRSTNAIAMPPAPERSTYRDLVLDDRPAVYLRLGEQAGAQTVSNLGTHGGDAVVTGNPQFGEPGALESDLSNDTAAWFDGNDHLTLRPEPGRQVRDTFTVEGWVRQDRYSPRWAFVFNHGAELRLDELGLHTPSGTHGGPISLTEWHHVAMVVRGRERDRAGEAEVFVDGVSRGTQPLTATGMFEVVYGDYEQVMGWLFVGALDELAIYDYRLTPQRIAEHASRGVTGFGAPPPANRTLPRAAVEAPRVGRTATCQDDTWTSGPRTFTFRWLRNGSPIPRATRREYALSADDLGHRITCAVTAHNIAGPSPQVTSPAAIVMPAPPLIDSYHGVVASDAPVVHLPLTSLAGGVTPNLGSHGGHAILQGNPVTAEGAIADSDDPAIRLDGNDWLELRPQAGSRVDGAFTAEGWVRIEGFPHWDTYLWASAAQIRIDDGALASHGGAFSPGPVREQWSHVALTHRPATRREAGATDIYLDGRLLGTLPPGESRVYDDLLAVVAGWHVLGSLDELAIYDYRLTPERVHAHYAAGRDGVAAAPPEAIGAPAVAGDARVGARLTCDEGSWTGSPTSYAYRWSRDGAAVAGATAPTYLLSDADAGTRLSCEVRATNPHGTSEWSASTGSVAVPSPPANIGPPSVTGTPKPGERVTCATGAWNATGTIEVRWQLDGPDVAGLPGNQYEIVGPDRGRVRCLVRMIGAGGASAWVAAPAIVIDAAPPLVSVTCPTEPVTPGSFAQATYAASDGGSGLATAASGTITLATSEPGTFTARVTARDNVGHASEGSCIYRVVHPRPAAPVPSRILTPDGLLRLSWTPPSGAPDPARYELQRRLEGSATWTAVAATAARLHDLTTPLADGRWEFRVRAVDPSFDDAWSAASAPVTSDRTPPTVSLACPTGTLFTTEPASATVTAADGGSGLVTPASGPVALDTATAGTRTAVTTARDAAGHTAQATCSYTVVHRGPGAPVLALGSTSPTSAASVTVTWPSLGPVPAPRYVLQARDADDAAWTTIASPTTRVFTASPTEGTWRLRVRADAASFHDAWSPVSEPVVVDRSLPYPPVPSADRAPDFSGAPGAWYRDRVTVDFAGAGDRTLTDGSPGSGVDASTIPAAAAYETSGVHTASGSVADHAGNRSPAASLTVRVDATAPALTVTCPNAELRVGETVTATFTASDAHSRLATAASGGVAADTATAGPKQLVVVARDNVGHTTTRTCNYTVVFPIARFDNALRTDRDNTVSAGTVVPIQFDLGGNFGLGVLDGTPTVEPAACDSRDRAFRDTLPSALPSLRYDATNEYRWAFVIDPAWRGTCRRLTVRLGDGTSGTWIFRVA